MNALDSTLDRWVEAGLISPETASDLRRFESSHHEDAPHEDAPPEVGGAPPRALALVGEVVGYLGAVLIVVAVTFLLRRAWGELPDGARIGIVAVLSAAVAFAGVLASRALAGPAQRLASVLFLATVGLSGWLAWVVTDVATTLSERPTVTVVTSVMACVAGAIYLWRRHALAQLASLATLAGVTAALLAPYSGGPPTAMTLTWAGLGAAWVILSAREVITPAAPGLIAGGLLMITGLTNGSGDGNGGTRGVMLVVAVVVAAALVAVAALHRPVVLLIIPGAIGLLQGVPALINHFWGDALAVWAGVLVTGLALVALAVRMVRGRGTARRVREHAT